MCPCGGVRARIGFEVGVDGRCVWRVENDAVAVEQSRACHSGFLEVFENLNFRWNKCQM